LEQVLFPFPASATIDLALVMIQPGMTEFTRIASAPRSRASPRHSDDRAFAVW